MSKKRLSLIAAAFLLAGCGHGSTSDPSDADSFQQAMAYAQCLRANGVPNFPDPQREGGGVKVSGGELLDNPAGRKAQETCRDKEPQGDGDGPGGAAIDPAKLSDWLKCMRAALPKFPDAQVTGGTITINLRGTGLKSDSVEFGNARRACETRFPGGSLKVADQ